jgi:hypothetical protein
MSVGPTLDSQWSALVGELADPHNTPTPTISDASTVCPFRRLLVSCMVVTGTPIVCMLCAVAIGAPHPGQAGAADEISRPHSGQLISAMLVPQDLYTECSREVRGAEAMACR